MGRAKLKDKYDVRLWYVAHTIKQGNLTIRHAQLSPEFSTRSKARVAYRELKKSYSDAYIVSAVVFFNPDRALDMVERAELVSKLH
jgi:hypothetical protein